jgi:hypothetical protein
MANPDDIKKAREERAAAAKAVSSMTATAAKTDAVIKKAAAQGEKTRKELAGESDE